MWIIAGTIPDPDFALLAPERESAAPRAASLSEAGLHLPDGRAVPVERGTAALAATALQTQLDNANAQLKTAQDGLKAFEGKKKPEEYEAELTKLQADMKAQADGFAFDSALNTAILGKKGRSVKAVRALLDLDALKGSKDRSADIDKALDDAAKANPWAFGEDGAAGVAVVSTGAEHGAPPANESNGVEAAFKSLNPELNL